MSFFPCPACGADKTIVIDSRAFNRFTGEPYRHQAVRRRRKCPEGHRFTTYESILPEGFNPDLKRVAERFADFTGNGYD